MKHGPSQTSHRVDSLRERVHSATGGVGGRWEEGWAPSMGEFYISLRCPTLIENDGVKQTWWGVTFNDAVCRAEQDINRWCDNAMAEKGGGDAG